MAWFLEALVKTATSKGAFGLSSAEVFQNSKERLAAVLAGGGTNVGYVYPHAPLELLLAHGITPTLIWADPKVQGGFEGSLQTFACSLARNLFSQRSNAALSSLNGFLFPANTCDSLQNLADVWRYRFPEDRIFSLAYPAARFGEDSVRFLAEELRILSESLKAAYGRPFSTDGFRTAVTLVNKFREAAQMLYVGRIVDPSLAPYAQVTRLVRAFLTVPTPGYLEEINNAASLVTGKLDATGRLVAAKSLQGELLKATLSDFEITVKSKAPRVMVVGGMTEPQAVASLFNGSKAGDGVVVLDMLSFGFRTVFTPAVSLDEEPFVAIAKSILSAPSEHTQAGLPARIEFLKLLLTRLAINGLVVCEQSFCDPDQFEAPSLIKAASEVGVPTVRLPMDPELSDRARLEGRIETFLETLDGDLR
jgi:benzoyl-CoA reductase/2-hydroxyglutaryl-CoA dehydratase subunit BcrC/BadD/HgdB